MLFLRSLPGICAALITVAAPLHAQKKEKEPNRPKLDAALDTNDWQVYHQVGMSVVGARPDKAVDYFYWASRLNPARAEPLYARWAATWMTKKELLVEYRKGAAYAVNSGEAQHIDSLAQLAFRRNPFVHEGLERVLLAATYDAQFGQGNWEWSANDENLAWLAYTERRFSAAASQFGELLAKNPNRYYLHAQRASAFQGMRQYDSALTELTALIDAMNKRDRKHLVAYYQSRAQYWYGIGILHQLMHDLPAAREAFGNALTEDLSFYMAHGALGGVALTQNDTTTALNEYGQAVQINGVDPVLRHDYGLVLLAAGKYDEAASQLAKAIELDPWFASAYMYLGSALDGQKKKSEALAQYGKFLALAPRGMGKQMDIVKKRMTELSQVSTGPTGGR
ncbi:MAG: tetratricopeptide repeat protein [Gemmatimonadaceae bacterium]